MKYFDIHKTVVDALKKLIVSSGKAILSFLCLITGLFMNAQNSVTTYTQNPFPQAYHALQTDTARMRFLVQAISDSLDEGQLTPVYDWAKKGLVMAVKNEVDTMKGIFLYDIAKAFTYHYSKYDSAIYYYKQVIPYFPDKMRKYNVYSVREIMDRYADLGNKDSSFAYMDMLKALIDTMPDAAPKKIALSQNIAVVYQSFGMYRTAMPYYEIAIKGSRLNKNFRGLGLALANLGELYNQMDDIDKAIQTSKEALINLADVPMPYMQTASNIADYYASAGQFDSSLRFIKIANAVEEKINDNASRAGNYSIMARIYIANKQYSKAKEILDKASALILDTDNSWILCRVLLAYSDLDTSLKQYVSAKNHLEKALDISKKNEFLPFSVLALQKLALVHTQTGDYKSALQYQMEYMKFRDSAATSKTKADLNDLEVTYKTLQQQQEIALLKKDNDIKNLQLANSNRMKLIYLLLSAFLIALFGIILYQRNRRNKLQTEKVKAKLETQILRAQMNPHFIFNSLNSIENFIMQNEKRLASDYLNKFSRLIRSILDSSRNEYSPLAKDMETLQLYVELEQLRFNNKFTYHSHVDTQLLNDDYRIPSLIIQPYVENAIVHGISHSDNNNLQLIVTALLENDKIKYCILDNGVGRRQAQEYNQQNKPGHKSVGLNITADRIAHFNGQQNVNGSVQITDLYDDENPAGTKVEIFLNAN